MPHPSTERRGSTARLLALTSKSKPKVDIALDDDQSEVFVPSYTTLEKFQGTVTITAPSDTVMDDLRVTFRGSIRTYVERVAAATPGNARVQASHTFLRLVQPIEAADMPANGILLAHRPYHFKFTFVVPETLLPQACTHPVENLEVYSAHLIPPPSLGDPMLAGDGKILLNDMCPENAEISYKLRVMIIRHGIEGEKPQILVDIAKKLRIWPKIDEMAPICSDDYVLKQEKTIKRGIFRGKLGILSVESSQPSSLHLPSIRDPDAARPSTMVIVNLRFDSADASLRPPKFDQLWTRLKIITTYAAEPQRDFPPCTASYPYDGRRGTYIDTIPLASRCIGAVEWTAHRTSLDPITEDNTRPPASAPPSRTTSPPPRRHSVFPMLSFFRRDSTFSRRRSILPFRRASSAATISGVSASPTHYHTAQVLVPITLPASSASSHRTFVPSFHSCLVSRIYAMDVALSVLAPAATSVRLTLPLQLSAAGNQTVQAVISEAEAVAITAREARMDDVGVHDAELNVLGDEVEPPGYFVWGGGR